MNFTYADEEVILKVGFKAEIDEVEGGNLMVDLYRIAEIEWDGTIGRYLFSSDIDGIDELFAASDAFEEKDSTGKYYVKMSYSDGDDSGLLVDALSEIAADAAKVLFKGDVTAEPVETVEVNSTSSDPATAERALYLGIVRPNGKTDQEDYLNTDEDAVTSFAYGPDTVYIFDPILIPLTNTDFEDIQLKYSEDVRYGDLEIVKILSRYVSGTPATFVFYIHAEKDGETVYDDYESLTFTGWGEDRVTLPAKIPMGAVVTVEEKYEGATYKLIKTEYSSGEEDLVIVPPDEEGNIATVTFTNDFEESNLKGYGVRNNYSVTEQEEGNRELKFEGNDLG